MGTVDRFVASHTLSAVMASRSNPGVVVNKQFLKLGQEIDGFLQKPYEPEALIQKRRELLEG